ncbi:uncharacterized protein LOC132565194 [Ylistrum balloti]|uniref:uncharacterized protein LOC132565194 n=1 Tax=Ylistrum balloti TaxID=509963 RepID=UPI002905B01E|nr:uncharacterized protein LOC132565194 [Ylistrum balloti]
MELIGRVNELEELQKEFNSKNVFAIYGLRSVGKSRLVETFLHQISWSSIRIDMRNMKSMRPVYMSLIERLMQDSISVKGFPGKPDILTEDWLTCIQRIVNEGMVKPTNIVLDNAEDVIETEELAKEFCQLCQALTATNRNIKVFITSTTEITFEVNSMISLFPLHLKPLDDESSSQLLTSYAPSVNFGSNMATIIELCEGLPLALLMTSSILEDEETLFSIDDMVHLLRLSRLEILSSSMYHRKERIAVVYGDFLQRLSVPLRQDLANIIYIPGSFTDSQASAMIGKACNKETHTTTIRPIMRRNIMYYNKSTDRFDVHRILRDCAAMYLEVKNISETRKRFCQIFASLIIGISEKVDSSEYLDGLCQYNLERQNFQKLLTDVIYTTEDTYSLYIEVALRATHVIQSFIIEYDFKFYTELLRMCHDNKNYVDEARIQIQYGSALTNVQVHLVWEVDITNVQVHLVWEVDITNVQGDLKTGENKYMMAVQFLEMNSVKGSTRDLRLPTALAYQRMGWNLGCQGRCQEALRYLYKALQVEQDLKMYYEELAMSTIQSLSIFHVTSGNIKEGIKLNQEALRRRIAHYKTEHHPYVVSCINNLGIAYRKLGREEEALHCFQRALIQEQATKAEPKSIAISQKNVAWSLTEFGKHSEAQRVITEAFYILNKTPNLYLEIRCHCHTTQGRIFRNLGKDEEAIKQYKTSLKIMKRHAPSLIDECMCHLEIALLQIKTKRYGTVLKRLDKVFRLGTELILEHPTSDILFNSYIVAIECHAAEQDMVMFSLRSNYVSREVDRLMQVCKEFELEDKIATLEKRQQELQEKVRDMKMTIGLKV